MIDHATGDITGFMMWLGKIGLAQARRGRPEVWIDSDRTLSAVKIRVRQAQHEGQVVPLPVVLSLSNNRTEALWK